MRNITKRKTPQQEMHPVEWYVKVLSEHHPILGRQWDGIINPTYAKIIKKRAFVVLEVSNVIVICSFSQVILWNFSDSSSKHFILLSQTAVSFFMTVRITSWGGNWKGKQPVENTTAEKRMIRNTKSTVTKTTCRSSASSAGTVLQIQLWQSLYQQVIHNHLTNCNI